MPVDVVSRFCAVCDHWYVIYPDLWHSCGYMATLLLFSFSVSSAVFDNNLPIILP